MERILFQGDSITDAAKTTACGCSCAIGQGYALMVVSELLRRGGKDYEFVNRGVSGNKVVDIYARAKKDIWNVCPDVISILVGINDAGCEVGEKNGVDADWYEKTYRLLVSETIKRLPNARLMLMEPFVLPSASNSENWAELRKEVELRANIVKGLANDFKVIFVPLQERFDAAASRSEAQNWCWDGAHPTLAGHRLIADAWLEAYDKL